MAHSQKTAQFFAGPCHLCAIMGTIIHDHDKIFSDKELWVIKTIYSPATIHTW